MAWLSRVPELEGRHEVLVEVGEGDAPVLLRGDLAHVLYAAVITGSGIKV